MRCRSCAVREFNTIKLNPLGGFDTQMTGNKKPQQNQYVRVLYVVAGGIRTPVSRLSLAHYFALFLIFHLVINPFVHYLAQNYTAM